MSSNLTATSVERIMPHAHLIVGAAMPVQAVRPAKQAGWRNDVQDVGTDRGYATTKFSTRLGPPSCSPPV